MNGNYENIYLFKIVFEIIKPDIMSHERNVRLRGLNLIKYIFEKIEYDKTYENELSKIIIIFFPFITFMNDNFETLYEIMSEKKILYEKNVEKNFEEYIGLIFKNK
jgi:hypothetical protein